MTDFGKEFWRDREFWKDAATFVALVAAFYIIYVLITYWPEIMEGFNRGWNSR